MAKIAPVIRHRFADNLGAPLAGGKLYTYEAGTATPKETYPDNTGSTPNANPIVLDAYGYGDIFLDTGGYKFVLKDATGAIVWTRDNIDSGNSTAYAGSVITKSAGFSLSNTEQNAVIVCTQSLTCSLLPVATAGDGFSALFVNQSTGNVTLDPDGAETINGASTFVIPAKASVAIHTDGTAWYVECGYLAPSITQTILVQSLFTTGDSKWKYATTAESGWVACSGRTIGSATSGATERANADTQALFLHLWTVDPNLTVSSGRGASAAADWAANKTIALPDQRGRAQYGLDNMGGSAANRVTTAGSSVDGATLGAAGGSQLMQQHNHGVNETPHSHAAASGQFVLNNGGGAATAGDVGFITNGTTNPNTATSTTGITIQNTGSGTSQNMPPCMMWLCMIKL